MTLVSSNNPAPSLSVLMPVYNAAPYVGTAIESVLNQTFSDFEFLIVDDGSTDDSADIVRRYEKQDPRIRFSSRENRGVSASRNELAALAKAPLQAVMDADDVCHPDRFEKQVAFLSDHPEVDVLGGWALMIDDAGRPIIVSTPPLDHATIEDQTLATKVSIMHPTIMMRTAAFRAAGGYDESLDCSVDTDLWLRIAEFGQLANLSEVLLDYRIHSGSLSTTKHEQQVKLAAEVLQRALARRGLPPRPLSIKRWRPDDSRVSQRDFALQCGWQAWKAGNQSTARHYFLKAIRIDPISVAAWKGVIFGLLKRP